MSKAYCYLVLGCFVALGCGDDETGGSSPAGTTGTPGATSGGGDGSPSSTTGSPTSTSGNTGGTGGVGGSGGETTTGGSGGESSGSAEAKAFCAEFDAKCDFGGQTYANMGACVAAFDGYNKPRQDCVVMHIGYLAAPDPASVHCGHAAGQAPCD